MNCPFCKAENEPEADTCFSCGRNLFSLTRGTVLSQRYEVQATLGRGGMGIVYKAYDRELDETVAIKLLRAEISHSSDASKRFRNEIRLARRVRHRNVCAIHEYGQEGHLRYIAMEYIAGTNYKQLLRANGPLPALEACGVAVQIADALHAIHDVGIVHRDLKTPNIMRDARGVVRLMDFGIAKVFEGDAGSAATGTGLVVGTPEYMSPEQTRAEKVDARSDIYALGIVLHELLTGDVPLRGETPIATLMKHASETPALDSPLLPTSLRTILRTALAKNRDERYRSADDMASDLRTAWKSCAPRAEPGHVARPLGAGRDGALRQEMEPEPMETTPLPTPVSIAVPTRPAIPAGDAVPVAGLAERTDLMPTPPNQRQAAMGRRPQSAGAITSLIIAALGLAWLGVELQRRAVPAPTAHGTVEVSVPAPVAAVARPDPARDIDPAGRAESPSPDPRRAGATKRGREATLRTPADPTTSRSAGAETPAIVAATTLVSAPALMPEPAAGFLKVGVRPYAEVLIDGRQVGTTPMKSIQLAPGAHVVRLVHPDYHPFQRRITIRPTETTRLLIDFALDGIPK